MSHIAFGFPTLFLLAGIALLAYFRHPTRARRLLVVSLFSLVVLFSWPPVSYLASKTLEWYYPVAHIPSGEAEAIVVLSATVYPARGARPTPLPSYSTFKRCRHAAWLYKEWRQVPILACGGASKDTPPYSHVMKEMMRHEGVPDAAIWTEDQSGSTYENAVNAVEILRSKGISKVALVTEAYHMFRAERCFLKQGIEVVPAPCEFRSGEFELSPHTFLPGATAIRHNEHALHEWLGYVWYWLRGRV